MNIDIKEGFFDRLTHSINLFKSNFMELFLPFFVYNFLSVVIIGTISKYYMMKSISGIEKTDGMDFFSFLNNPVIVIGIVIGIFLFIIYLMLYVVVLLGFLKSMKQVVSNKKITTLENIKYGVLNFMNSMKTYWYVFAYVALIPSIIFIFGGIFFNVGFYFGNLEILKAIGGGLIGVSAIIFIIFAIYRGLKSTFALYSAVDKDNFSKENFNDSLMITNNNWYRIVGNFLFVGLLVSLVSSLIGGIIGLFSFFSGDGASIIDEIMSGSLTKDPKTIIDLMKNYSSDFSIQGEILKNIIDNILNTMFSVFILIFTYLFYKRLELEHGIIKKVNNERIEL